MPRIPFTTPDGQSGTIDDTPDQIDQAKASGWVLPTVQNTEPSAIADMPVESKPGKIKFITPDFETGTIDNDPEQIKQAKDNYWHLDLDDGDYGNLDYNYGMKIKSNIDAIDNGEDIVSKYKASDLITSDGKYKVYEYTGKKGNPFESKDITPDEFLKGLPETKYTFRDSDAGTALIAAMSRPTFLNRVKEGFDQASQGASDVAKLGIKLAAMGVNNLPGLDLLHSIDPMIPGKGQTLSDDNLQTINSGVDKVVDKLNNPFSKLDSNLDNLASRSRSLKDTTLKDIGKIASLAPVAAATGGLAGAALEGGALALGAGETLASGLGAAGGLFAEGAVLDAPHIAEQAIKGDYAGASESILNSGGLNLLFGGLGKIAGVGSKLAEEGIQTAEHARAVDSVLTDLGATPEKLSSATPEVKEHLTNLFRESVGSSENLATKGEKALADIALGQTEGIAETAAKLSKFAESPTNLAQTIASKTTNLFDTAEASQMGKEIAKITENGKVSLPGLLEFIDRNQNLVSKEGNQVLNKIREEAVESARMEFLRLGDEAVLKSNNVELTNQWLKESNTMKLANDMRLQVPNSGVEQLDTSTGMLQTFLKKGFNKLAYAPAHMLAQTAASAIPLPGSRLAAGVVARNFNSKFVKPIVNRVLETMKSNPEAVSKTIPTLSKFEKQGNQALASYLTLDALHATDHQLSKIPDILKNLGSAAGKVSASNPDIFKQILGSKTNGLSKQQQFKEVSTHLSNLVSNPTQMQQHVQEVVGPFLKDHPELAKQMEIDLNNKIQYLHQLMPKNPNPPKPFQKDDHWQPSKLDMDDVTEQFKIAQNPFALLKNLQDGTVTAKQVATASMFNPVILNKIRETIQAEAYGGKIDLNYHKRLQASLIMGQNMDDSLNKVHELQQVYAPAPAEQMSAPAKKPHKASSKIKDNSASLMTPAQRLLK